MTDPEYLIEGMETRLAQVVRTAEAVREDPSLGQRILRLTQEAQAKLPDAMRAGVPSAQGTGTLDAIVTQT